ncbi:MULTISPECIES: hypothetical protein [unclassified Beijerinckia]|uniref:hypothetical protein n=1 Tax=unclassified Beijerinckia TaxID=2638183 RepID=UPI00089A4033|nr:MULTISPECIES: hypothetical protein [unclassified Beijerinckia]MDH7796429.1 hypothetical protein [Beijerinckia sp. GAS462]SEC44712.1 hypothetical protein SAMN05443249_2711 [Beijerinckia sp. 28-YEA-48]
MAVNIRFSLRVGRRGAGNTNPADNAAIKAMQQRLSSYQISADKPSENKKVQQELQNWMMTIAGGIASQKVRSAIMASRDQIVADLNNDLEEYTRKAIQFFTSRQSSHVANRNMAARDLHLSLDDVAPSGFTSSLLDKRRSVVSWKPLQPKTIKKKSGDTTFYVFSGDLKKTLNSRLPGMFKDILHPGIKLSFDKNNVLNVSPTLATTGKVSGRAAFIQGQVFDGKDINNVLIRNYLKNRVEELGADVAYKLGVGKGQKEEPKRPWVDATVSYWALRRYPHVMVTSVRKRVSEALKNV